MILPPPNEFPEETLSHVQMQANGTLVNPATGAMCHPPGPMEWHHSYVDGSEMRLYLTSGHPLHMGLINDLTETLLFFQDLKVPVVILLA